MATRLVKLRAQRDLLAGVVFSTMSPKVFVKIDLLFRGRRFGGRVHFYVIIFLCEFDLAVIKSGLQLFHIFSRTIHRGQMKYFGNFRQNRFLFLSNRILPQKILKLLFVPHPCLFKHGLVAAGKEKPKEIRKIPCQRMNVFRRYIHGADRKNHPAKTTDEAEVNSVHACPAENGSAFRRTEIRRIILPAFDPPKAQGRYRSAEIFEMFYPCCRSPQMPSCLTVTHPTLITMHPT